MRRIYLDWAATAVPDENILKKAFNRSLNEFGNPSSPHERGKKASLILKDSRDRCAQAFGCSAGQLFFTSGGTESNNIILSSLLRKQRKGNIVITGIEHSAVYEPALILEKAGWEVRIVNTQADGIIDPEQFCSRVDKDTLMAAMILVNNETGAVQPAAETGRMLKTINSRTHFHIDAVQAAGKIPLNLDLLPVDSAAISSHKFRGPRGAGLLYLKKPVDTVYAGGGQENSVRSGTENIYGALATADAASAAIENIEENLSHALDLKKTLISRLSGVKGLTFLPHNKPEDLLDTSRFSPYILSVSIRPVPGEILVRVISDRGFDIATGSACATGKKKKSRVMEAMGVDQQTAFSTVRISTGPSTDIEEIDQFCNIFIKESTILKNQLTG